MDQEKRFGPIIFISLESGVQIPTEMIRMLEPVRQATPLSLYEAGKHGALHISHRLLSQAKRRWRIGDSLTTAP